MSTLSRRPGRPRRARGARARRGAAGTALAVVAVAALTASQAPGAALSTGQDDRDEGPDDSWTIPKDAPSDDVYHTELPPLGARSGPEAFRPKAAERIAAQSGIPATVLAAYRKAAGTLHRTDAQCGLRWELLAAIGRVESGQARGGDVTADGTTRRPILGPLLNGDGFARITDTDAGRHDGDRRYDRAVGPMQFIPSTWASWGADGNGDGSADAHNVFDAALAAGHYLCADGRDLTVKRDLDRAVLSYNNSRTYLETVLGWFAFYRTGVHSVPDGEGELPTSQGAGGENPRSAQASGKGSAGTKHGKGKHGSSGKGKGGGVVVGPTPGGGSSGGSGGSSGGGASPGPTPSDPDPSQPGDPDPTEPPECDETESPAPSPSSTEPSTLPADVDDPCESGEPSPSESSGSGSPTP